MDAERLARTVMLQRVPGRGAVEVGSRHVPYHDDLRGLHRTEYGRQLVYEIHERLLSPRAIAA